MVSLKYNFLYPRKFDYCTNKAYFKYYFNKKKKNIEKLLFLKKIYE